MYRLPEINIQTYLKKRTLLNRQRVKIQKVKLFVSYEIAEAVKKIETLDFIILHKLMSSLNNFENFKKFDLLNACKKALYIVMQ